MSTFGKNSQTDIFIDENFQLNDVPIIISHYDSSYNYQSKLQKSIRDPIGHRPPRPNSISDAISPTPKPQKTQIMTKKPLPTFKKEFQPIQLLKEETERHTKNESIEHQDFEITQRISFQTKSQILTNKEEQLIRRFQSQTLVKEVINQNELPLLLEKMNFKLLIVPAELIRCLLEQRQQLKETVSKQREILRDQEYEFI
ncbi:hypothetical protein pb186bvf_008181 [Paramecium bursaria]